MALNLSASQFFGKNMLSLSPQANRLQTDMGQSLRHGSQVLGEIQTLNSVFFPNQHKKPNSQIFLCIKILPTQF